MAQFARMFDSWALLTQYVFYILLVLLPLTAWRKQDHVGEVYGLLILSVIFHEIFDVLECYSVFMTVSGSSEVAIPGALFVALYQGLRHGGAIFVLLLVGMLYQYKRKRSIKKLKKWALIVLGIMVIFLVIIGNSDGSYNKWMDMMNQIIMDYRQNAVQK